MRRLKVRLIYALAAVLASVAGHCDEGGFYGGLRWFYPQPTVSDGDLQYCTALTLTPGTSLSEAQNLSAHVVQIQPDYTSAYRAHFGYLYPCSGYNVEVAYFHFRASDSDSVTSPIRNIQTYQFLQNFLGGGFVSGKANSRQKLDQFDVILGKRCFVDCIEIHPYIGLSYIYLSRNLDVTFNQDVDPPMPDPVPATVVGSLGSHAWGLGPMIGSDFSLPLLSCLDFTGKIGVVVLGGRVSSKLTSNSVRDFQAGILRQSFDADGASYRLTPVVRSDLGLTYTYPIWCNRYSIDLSIGYEIDYYFRAVDRIDPFNGYLNNPDSFSVKTTSNLGLGGPYAQIALTKSFSPCCREGMMRLCPPACGYGLYFSVENGWLQPVPTEQDLNYGTLQMADGSTKSLKVEPDHSWSGSYHLGFRFPCNLTLDAGYRYFSNEKSDAVDAAPTEAISSLNSSGPASTLFSSARSRVEYTLHQADLSIGKGAALPCHLDLYGFVGMRYLNLKRTLDNAYLGGIPGTITQSKFPVLRSRYWGVGPLMGVTPRYALCGNFGLTGLLDLALLVGESNATLDQVNFGTLLGETSNTLRTRDNQTIVPVLDTKLAAFWSFCLYGFQLDLEAGYLFSDYFKGVNLVFPNFLTGLGQSNSSLLLHGPYITLNIGGF